MPQQIRRLRGYAVRDGSRWASLILDYDIAANGDTPEEAIRNCILMTRSYIESCLEQGKSPSDCRRPAPLRYWLKYLWLFFKHNLPRTVSDDGGGAFDMPLAAAC